MVDSDTMTLPISLAALALLLGLLSALLAYLVGKRYHQINTENGRRLREFDEQLKSHTQLHRSHTRRLQDLDAEFRMCRSQIAQLNTSTGGFWRTAIGTIVQIRQMSDNHIANAIAHLEETGRGSSESMTQFRNEQRRRRYDVKMSARTPAEVFKETLLGSPSISIEEKGTAKLIEPKTSFVMPPIDWPQVDKVVSDLVNRTVMSRGLNADLVRLQHLLGRGRRS